MSFKILINGITLDSANTTPLLINIKYWQEHNCQVDIIGNKILKKNITSQKIIKPFNYIYINENSPLTSKLKLILVGFKRNLILIRSIKNYLNKYSIIHSRSSVLDLIIFPYFLKFFDKKIKWTSVFDNTVSLIGSGKVIDRVLAFMFFQISLIFLKKADSIFVISIDLKKFLLSKGFNKAKIILTGNAIEKNLIIKANQKNKIFDAIYVGRINESKGIYDLLEVLKIVRKTLPKFQLAIMGEGDIPSKQKFLQLIANNHLQKNIKLLGYKTGADKFSLIKSSKTFWFFSHGESFGIALLEAVCCGLKAFTYQLQPFRVIYKNHEIYQFKFRDYQIIAKSIIKVFKSKNFLNKNGLKLLDKYDWNRIAQIELNTFQKII